MRKNRAMPIPPTQKPTQTDFVQTAVRMPRELRAQIQEVAERKGHSMNAEILARLDAAPLADQMVALVRSNAELKAMIKQLLEK